MRATISLGYKGFSTSLLVPTVESEDNSAAQETEQPTQEATNELPKLKECPLRTHFRTTNPSQEIDIAMGTEGLAAAEPMTVGQMFKDTVSKIPDNIALRFRENDEWKDITYSHYYDMVVRAAKSFLKVSLYYYKGKAIDACI